MKIAGIRFRDTWKVYDFDASDVELAVGDSVIVDTEKGQGFGKVVRLREGDLASILPPPPPPHRPQKAAEKAAEEEVEIEIDIDDAGAEAAPLSPAAGQPGRYVRKVLRKATEDDRARDEKNRAREREAERICRELISERELPMRLIRAEYSFDGGRVTFFFFAENRVDFRELVKDLAHKLRARIEMRQIGVRDVARLIGGFGPCGRELCCASFLRGFEPVSIRMAKKQELVLNPAKISGVCGRLLCCLAYEYEMYDEIKKDIAAMREAAEKEKQEALERRMAEERREAEVKRAAEERRREADERRRQEQPRRETQQRGQGQKGVRPAKPREQAEQKKQIAPEQQREQGREQQKAAPQAGQAGEPAAQQPAKQGKGKRRRFWRKKKKDGREGQQTQ